MSLGTLGWTWNTLDAVHTLFAQALEPHQKRGKVGSVEQSFLAEFYVFEVASFDRGVERGTSDAEQVECLADCVSGLRKTESTGINWIGTGSFGRATSWHCAIRQIVVALFAGVGHGTHCAIRAGLDEQPVSSLFYAVCFCDLNFCLEMWNAG